MAAPEAGLTQSPTHGPLDHQTALFTLILPDSLNFLFAFVEHIWMILSFPLWFSEAINDVPKHAQNKQYTSYTWF